MRWISIVLLLGAGSALRSDDFPLKRVPALTYVVDYEPFWSPDGLHIVLISTRHGAMKVHVIDATPGDGSSMRQLTTGNAEDDSPAWSPDGRKIAFVSIRGGVSKIFVMNADGTSVRQVTTGSGQDIHPMWSPDSRRILFNTTHYSEQEQQPTDGADVRRVIGEKIDEAMNLATIRPDGTDLRRITSGGGTTYASFSPDGKSILHRHARSDVSQVYLMNADGSDDHNLSGQSTSDGWPAWSPDGKRIVFARQTSGSLQIFVMNRDGSGVRQLTDAAEGFTNPRWSPDGSKILCSRRAFPNITLVMFAAPP
jgi:TolB protein